MKKYFICVFVFISSVFTLSGQGSTQLNSWFTVKELYPKIWLINDHNAVNIYLIEGQDSALLVDTGIGTADLASVVKSLTGKPLIVINTHGHTDHAGGDYQFSKIYIHPADSTAARLCDSPESRAAATKNMLRGIFPQPYEKYNGPSKFFKLVPVHSGHLFNLGDRQLEVIETPGHTPGSICLLDRKNKLLFSGDNNNTAVWLFLSESRPLSVYFKTLEYLSSRISEFNTILPGHGIPKKSDFILDQIMCVKSILNHSCVPEPYTTFAGTAKLCQYGRASVAYNPDNL